MLSPILSCNRTGRPVLSTTITLELRCGREEYSYFVCESEVGGGGDLSAGATAEDPNSNR
jgi:hypothetical protein